MSAPDMDVIKEIPGYKVILKAVLKSQIQQLVETLANHTDEESVILTASVSDGTLSHLGSDSGKYFLEDHEDVKSQFLGFCLKRHHRKKQSENEALKNPPVVQPQFGMGSGYSRPSFSPRTRMSMPRQSTPRHSMVPQGGYRPAGRHEPYPLSRPIKRSSQDSHDQGMGASVLPPSSTVGSTPVKVEPADNDGSDLNSSAVPSSSQTNNDSSVSDSISGASKGGTAEGKPGNSVSGMDESTQDSNISSDATLPNTPNAQNTENNESDLDPNVSVKFESVTQNDMELEITGVEPGATNDAPQEEWVPDSSLGMPYDPTALAGNQLDLSAGSQDYSVFQTSGNSFMYDQPEQERSACEVCGKTFTRRFSLKQHMAIHTGLKPYRCQYCDKRFIQRSNWRRHMVNHTGKNVKF